VKMCEEKTLFFAVLVYELRVSHLSSPSEPKLNDLLLLLYMDFIFVNLIFIVPSENPIWIRGKFFHWYLII
jgi:hypothetical protein